MYWGHSLLWFLTDKVADVQMIMKRLAYALWSMLPKLFYAIWRLIGWAVSGIEKIFRNLAGLGEKGDIVSDIIANPIVDQIFKNMIGLSTALIIFFTIVKIIQDHYKEKENGGNPYKIVIRTFKGLLMFFFVNAAVVVGLYASGVMFRALDAATGTGATSVAGLAFKAMASEANRKQLGEASDDGLLSDVTNEYWNRMSNDTSDVGRYFIVGFNDNEQVSGQSLKARYTEAFPIYQYGVVDADGSVRPLTKWLHTADSENPFDPVYWEERARNQLTIPDPDTDWDDDGKLSAWVGYKSDLLRGFDLCVTPSIDLTWSPVDIDVYGYKLAGTKLVDHSQMITAFGSSVYIPISTQWQQFVPTQKTSKSLEESAKQFGISFKGNVALQDNTASARYSLDSDGLFSKKFDQILSMILINIVYTNTLVQLIQLIPEFPAAFQVGPVAINYIQVLAPILETMFDKSLNFVFSPLIPENNEGEPCVEIFTGTPLSHNGGIWCIMNFKSNTVDTTIEQYRVDKNFSDLWGQLKANMDQFKKQLQTLNDKAFVEMQQGTQSFLNTANRINEQQNWQAYMGKVNEYNRSTAGRLELLGNLLTLHDAAVAAIPGDDNSSTIRASRGEWIKIDTNGGYNGDWDRLESEIKKYFSEMVSMYDSMINGQRPVENKADVVITRPVYKPIIEFGLDETAARGATVAQIKEFFQKKAARINLLMDPSGAETPAAYRVVDWQDAYGYMYIDTTSGAGLRNTADLYYTYETRYDPGLGSDVTIQPINKSLVNTIDNLRFLSLETGRHDDNTPLLWNEFGGVRYFADKGYGINYGRSSAMTLKDNSYWGTDGLYLDGVKEYKYYEGTTYRPGKKFFDDLSLSGASVNGSSVRPSTAAINEQTLLAQSAQTTLIDELTTVDNTNPEVQKHANEIVTFRKLNTADDPNPDESEDMKAKKTWLSEIEKIQARGTPAMFKMLHEMSPNEIDSYMAGTEKAWFDKDKTKGRAYLLMTPTGISGDADIAGGNWGSYIGQFSWQDHNTVFALYSVNDMNFVVGFITIIAALGVYMNFAFALIQRAVKMAVLHVLSPITIAFYPFDDGSKFNSTFVKPFYNEAISAFAVIVSLNLFVLLMQPLESAVANVAGTAISWIALVAFVSMLPQIRDTVYSILGGSKMSEKSLTDTFKDAGKTMGKSFSDFRNLGATTAHGLDSVNKWRQQKKATASAKEDQAIDDLEAKKAKQGYLSRFEQARLDRLKARQQKRQTATEKAAQKDANIDKVRNDYEKAMKEAGDDKQKQAAAKAAFEQAKLGLSRSERRRMNKQDKAAAKIAAQQVDRAKFGNDEAGQKAYESAVAARKSELLNNTDFKKSVNGNIVTKAARGLAERGRALKYRVNNSILGEALHDYFGPDGKLANDKNSLIGAGLRWNSPAKNAKIRAERSAQYIKERDEKYAVLKDVTKTGKELEEALAAEDDAIAETVQAAGASVARQKAEANGLIDTKKKLTSVLSTKYLKNHTKDEALALAEQEILAEEKKHALTKTSTVDKIKDIVFSNKYAQAHNLNGLQDANDEFISLTSNKSEAELKALYESMGGDKTFTELPQYQNQSSLTAAQRNDFLLAMYNQAGGDAKFDAGVAKGLQEYGVAIDMNDADVLNAIKAEEEKQRALMERGSSAIAAEITAKKAAHEEKIAVTAALLAKDLDKEGDLPTINSLIKILSKADADTTSDDLAREISGQLKLDLGDVQTKVNEAYPKFAEDIQFDVEIEQLAKMQKAATDYEAALKTWDDNIGNGVSAKAKSEIIAAFKQNFNGDLNSTDPNSLGYQKRQIILKYQSEGGLANAQCQAEIEQLHVAAQARISDTIAEFIRKNGEAIRVHNDAKAVREGARSLYANKAFDAIMEGYDKVQSVISRYASDALVKDSMMQKFENDGNLAGAGDMQMQLINAIREHRYDYANSLGFDAATVNYFKQLEIEGDPRGDLDKVYDAAKYASSYLGGTSPAMGGDSMQGAARTAGMLYSISVKSKRNEKMEILKSDAGHKEQYARDAINLALAKLDQTFKSKNWAHLQGQVVDEHGNVVAVGDADGVAKALRYTIEQLNRSAKNAETDNIVKRNLQILNDWKEEHINKLEDQLLVQQADIVLGCVEQAIVAEQASNDTDAASQTIGITERELADLMNKIGKKAPGQ
ncbi:MAG: hypothetical protein J5580_00585 [Clostridia bacterium]|nr:hypothetical protein [Clostridia bacterium]